MFSQLGPLFRTQFRRAESNDTRQQTPHEERNRYTDKNKQEHKENKTVEKWNDDTIVSVTALKSFLINFLKTLPDAQSSGFLENYAQEATPIPTRPKQKIRPTNTHNAKAVRAYQTMASHSTRKKSESTSSPQVEDASQSASNNEASTIKTNNDDLQSDELREIHLLITDLDLLQSKNITELHILKADSFVDAMKQAVDLVKSKI